MPNRNIEQVVGESLLDFQGNLQDQQGIIRLGILQGVDSSTQTASVRFGPDEVETGYRFARLLSTGFREAGYTPEVGFQLSQAICIRLPGHDDSAGKFIIGYVGNPSTDIIPHVGLFGGSPLSRVDTFSKSEISHLLVDRTGPGNNIAEVAEVSISSFPIPIPAFGEQDRMLIKATIQLGPMSIETTMHCMVQTIPSPQGPAFKAAQALGIVNHRTRIVHHSGEYEFSGRNPGNLFNVLVLPWINQTVSSRPALNLPDGDEFVETIDIGGASFADGALRGFPVIETVDGVTTPTKQWFELLKEGFSISLEVQEAIRQTLAGEASEPGEEPPFTESDVLARLPAYPKLPGVVSEVYSEIVKLLFISQSVEAFCGYAESANGPINADFAQGRSSLRLGAGSTQGREWEFSDIGIFLDSEKLNESRLTGKIESLEVLPTPWDGPLSGFDKLLKIFSHQVNALVPPKFPSIETAETLAENIFKARYRIVNELSFTAQASIGYKENAFADGINGNDIPYRWVSPLANIASRRFGPLDYKLTKPIISNNWLLGILPSRDFFVDRIPNEDIRDFGLAQRSGGWRVFWPSLSDAKERLIDLYIARDAYLDTTEATLDPTGLTFNYPNPNDPSERVSKDEYDRIRAENIRARLSERGLDDITKVVPQVRRYDPARNRLYFDNLPLGVGAESIDFKYSMEKPKWNQWLDQKRNDPMYDWYYPTQPYSIEDGQADFRINADERELVARVLFTDDSNRVIACVWVN